MKLIATLNAALAAYRSASARLNEIKRSLGIEFSIEDADVTLSKEGIPTLRGKVSGSVAVSKELATEIRRLRASVRLGNAMRDAGLPLGALVQVIDAAASAPTPATTPARKGKASEAVVAA